MTHLLNNSITRCALAALLCLASGTDLAHAAVTITGFGEGWKVKLPAAGPPQDPGWDARSRTIRIAGARNEVVAFQLLIDAGTGSLAPLRITTGPLAGDGGSLPRASIQVFRQRFVRVTVPSKYSARERVSESEGAGWYPAQLVPLADGMPFGVRASTGALWVDVAIPRDGSPGMYHGDILLRGLPDGDLGVRVELTIWDFAIPDEVHFKSYGYFGPEFIPWAFPGKSQEALLAIEREFFRMAHRHRLNLVANLEPDAGFDPEAWWRRYGGYIDGSAFGQGSQSVGGAPLWAVWINAQEEGPFKVAAKQAVDLFAGKGFSRVPFLYVLDEPNSLGAYDAVRRRCRWAKEAAGRALPCMVTEQITPQKPEWGSLVGFVDIWNSGDSSPQEMATRRAAGDRTWVYNAGGPYGGPWYIDTPPVTIHRWAWGAWAYGIEAWHLWHTNYWVDKFNLRLRSRDIAQNPSRYLASLWDVALTFDETRKRGYRAEWAIQLNGDGVLLYPGTSAGIDGPVATPQIKAFRRAAQTYEYLWLLSQRGGTEQISAVMKTVHGSLGQWETDPVVWDRARHALAAEILKRGTARY